VLSIVSLPVDGSALAIEAVVEANSFPAADLAVCAGAQGLPVNSSFPVPQSVCLAPGETPVGNAGSDAIALVLQPGQVGWGRLAGHGLDGRKGDGGDRGGEQEAFHRQDLLSRNPLRIAVTR
jgi:hypothetical protein